MDAIPRAEWAPARACGLEKYFHPSLLTSGDRVLWMGRDNFFLSFRLHGLSYVTQLSLKGGWLMEFLQRSECQHGSVSLLDVPRQGEYWPKGPLI